MTRPARAAARPVPHLDEGQLLRMWTQREPAVGRVVALGGRRYRVRGCDPFSVRPHRVYLEDVGSGREHALVTAR